jgi:hypothetical protein
MGGGGNAISAAPVSHSQSRICFATSGLNDVWIMYDMTRLRERTNPSAEVEAVPAR